MNKREFLKAGFMSIAGLAALKTKANSSSKLIGTNTFKVPSIPYSRGIENIFSQNSYQALYKNHISNSIVALNKDIQSMALTPRSVRSIIIRNNDANSELTKNACDFYNHKLFFKLVSGESSNKNNANELIKEIENDFGSLSVFLGELKHKALVQKKDCWLWLNKSSTGLRIVTTSDKQNPLLSNALNAREFPIMGFDLCQHTYQNDYKSDKSTYITNILKNINWEYANKRYKSSEVFLKT